MILLEKLEERMSLPGDSETRRKQKVAALIAGVAGMAIAFFTAWMLAPGGAPEAVWLQIGLGVFMFIPVIWLLVRPGDYAFWVVLTAVIVTIHPWLVNFFTGGFQSGIFQPLWSMFGPFSAVLLLGVAPAVGCAALLLFCAVIGVLTDPLAAAMAPALAPGLRLTLGFFNIVALSFMVLIPTMYLFREEEKARAQADVLLLNILPAPIAARLKQDAALIADHHADVTVLFADIAQFTQLSAEADPSDVVGLLNHIFTTFDDLADQYRLEKIKTIGDAYMVAAGLPLPREDHCEAVAAFAVELLAAVQEVRAWNGEPVCVRVGIHSGPVVAGVIGRRKFSYDLWGDTVNTASRMESHGLGSAIQVTAVVKDKLGGRYEFEERPPIYVKGKGMMTTYLLRAPQQNGASRPSA
jgi:class 3 adenylate cyclase